MDPCFLIELESAPNVQTESDLSFIGGFPRLPQAEPIPLCSLCRKQQSFFFQLTFPLGHLWANLSLAMFQCTDCADENHFIPEMLKGPLPGAVIPAGFLETYQKNFKTLVFDSGSGRLRKDYTPRVKFTRIILPKSSPSTRRSKIGGKPNWYLDNESPARYGDQEMFFLLQLMQGTRFPLEPGAPKQVELGLSRELSVSPNDYYELFISNYLYFFGTKDRNVPAVYILPQI